MKHSIKKSVWTRVIIIFAVVILSSALTFMALLRLTEFNRSTKSATEINSIVLGAQRAHYGWMENLASSIAFNTEFTGSTDYTGCELGKWLYGTDPSTLPDERIAPLMEEMKNYHQAVHESAITILENSSNATAVKNTYENVTTKNVEALVGLLNEVSDITSEMVAKNESSLHNAILFTEASVVGTIILIVLVSGMLVSYIMKKVVKPIASIAQSGSLLAQGNLGFQIDVQNKDDEIELLANNLNSAVRTLKSYIADISSKLHALSQGDLSVENEMDYLGDFATIHDSLVQIFDQMNATMSKVRMASEQVGSSANDVSNGAQQLAQGATEQANEIENLVATVHQIADQVRSNAENAAATREGAENVGTQISSCNEQMNSMTHAMSEISVCSKEIGNIIKTIDDIAFQTNILALNAAVEAARAGSAGKGFAVVADEVRNLAAKSAQAAQSTTELIEKTLVAVSNGETLAKDTQESLLLVVTGTQEVVEKIRNISAASTEQASSVDVINTGLSQISAVVQTNSATSEESAAASEELSSQAQLMNSLMNQFRLKNTLFSPEASLPAAVSSDFSFDSMEFSSNGKY